MPIFQFRDCGRHILPRIVAKIRPELKLINVDFVLGGQKTGKKFEFQRGTNSGFSFRFIRS